MGFILGIDVGGSTTKIVGRDGLGRLFGMLQVKADDPVTSVYGAFGKFVNENGVKLGEIDRIALTGVGASYFPEDIYGIPTVRISEFLAIGKGGLALSGKDEAIVVSMGTGTAFIRASAGGVVHLGGSGVGGGTIVGLCDRMVNASRFETITQLVSGGDLSSVDLAISDISRENINSLPPNLTASNFGKLSDTATNADIALGIVNMAFQTIGMLAVFACRNDSIKEIVLTGTLANMPQAEEVFGLLCQLYGLSFTVPRNAVFATAIGAALSQV